MEEQEESQRDVDGNERERERDRITYERQMPRMTNIHDLEEEGEN